MTLNSRAYKSVPEVVAGYGLNKLQFSIILPIERTNLITNPSFETNTTGYTSIDGATLTRTTETQRRGVFSLRIKPGASSVSGVFYTSSALVAGQTYAFSLDVNIRGGRKFQIRAFDGVRSLVTKPVTGKGYWERIAFVFTAVTSGAHRFYFEKNGDSNNATTDNVFTDGWQLELCESGNYWETTYIDGDQTGLVVNQVPAAYYWNGIPGASTSIRTNQTRSGGRVMKLSDMGFQLLSVVGFGMSRINNVIIPLGIVGGAIFQRDVPLPRDITLVGSISGSTFTEYSRNKQLIEDAIRYDSVAVNQPLVLQYQYGDCDGEQQGEVQQIACSYIGGLEGNNNNYHQERIGIKFTAAQPYIQNDGNRGANLGYAQDIVTNRILWRDTTGQWNALGSGITAGLIEQIVVGQDGLMYVGGAFTAAGGAANTSRIASYDTTTGLWRSLGIGANAAVVSLVVGPDGSIYAGGDFTLMDGVANTVRIAKWNPTTRTWTPLSTGANGSVRAMAFGVDGNLYVGGDFTTIGGVAAARIARWDGASWSALGAGLTGGAPVGRIIISGPDGNIYVGGTFTAAGGVTAGSIAKYNPLTSTWSAISTGTASNVYALGFGLDGVLYAGGDFTTMGGIPATLAAKWNGIAWSPVGDGFDVGVLHQINAITVDQQGLVYFSGLFDVTGSLSFLTISKIAVWNGSSFTYIDVVPAGTPGVNEVFIDKTGRLFTGFQAAGNGFAPVLNLVTNDGSALAFPTIKFTGPGRVFQITNQTTNKSIYFNITLIANEIATLELTPTKVSFTSNLRGNIIGFILPGSNLTDFYLQSGDNVVSLLITNTSAASLATLLWRETNWSFDFNVR